MNPQTEPEEVCELLNSQIAILQKIHFEATDPPGRLNPKAELANFLFHHALHIHSLAKATLLLLKEREPYSIPILGRSAMESAFSMVAAMEDKCFGPQRIAFELEDLSKKLNLLLVKGVWTNSRRPTPEECLKEARDIRAKYSAPIPEKQGDRDGIQKVERIAKTAGLTPFYDDDYRQLSLCVHGNQAGILNAASGFLIRKGALAVCNATFLASHVLGGAFRIGAHDVQLEEHHRLMEKLMQRPEFSP